MKDYIAGIRTVKCKKCGKEFVPAPQHVFKKGSDYYCKWTCFNHRKDKPNEKGGNAYDDKNT